MITQSNMLALFLLNCNTFRLFFVFVAQIKRFIMLIVAQCETP